MPPRQQVETHSVSTESVHELTDAVLSLTDQVRMLRLAVDEIEQELGWAIRTRVLDNFPTSPPTRITSLPLDPLCEDFHRHVNAVQPADLLEDDWASVSAHSQRSLFD